MFKPSKNHIVKMIDALTDRINNSPYTLEDSQAAHDQFKAAWKRIEGGEKMTQVEKDDFLALSDGPMNLINDMRQLDQYNVTMNTEIVQLETDFVVTDTMSLESPAGFHPDEKVFVETNTMIEMSKAPRHGLPNTWVHDLRAK